jgi:hypothetical protein
LLSSSSSARTGSFTATASTRAFKRIGLRRAERIVDELRTAAGELRVFTRAATRSDVPCFTSSGSSAWIEMCSSASFSLAWLTWPYQTFAWPSAWLPTRSTTWLR